MGVNPRGLRPLDVWQMDVTHIPSFGKLQYVHVSIDTSSGVLHASPLTGEKAVHVISHCLEAWAAWGKPLVLKTDNGPAYTSSKFSQFCKQMQVKHITGLPYNPQGQGIIERAHRTLKQYLRSFTVLVSRVRTQSGFSSPCGKTQIAPRDLIKIGSGPYHLLSRTFFHLTISLGD